MSAHLRKLVGADGHACLGLARVAAHEGQADYFRVNGDGEVEVDVIMDAHGAPVTALLGAVGGLARGVWAVPPEGAEVLVAYTEGDFEGDAVLVCGLGVAPGELDESTIVIVAPSGGKVIVHDGSGAQALAYKSDVEALRATFNTHTHVLAISGASGSGATGTAAVPTTPASAPVGTSVLEAK